MHLCGNRLANDEAYAGKRIRRDFIAVTANDSSTEVPFPENEKKARHTNSISFRISMSTKPDVSVERPVTLLTQDFGIDFHVKVFEFANQRRLSRRWQCSSTCKNRSMI